MADALRAARHVPRRLAHVDGDGRERFALGGAALDRPVGERRSNLLRGDIERALYERVRDGVEVRFGASVESLQERRDGVGVRLGDGAEVGCDLVVGARRFSRPARRSQGGPPSRPAAPRATGPCAGRPPGGRWRCAGAGPANLGGAGLAARG